MPRKFSKKTPNCSTADLTGLDWRTNAAAGVLLRGGVVAHATEAVFGLAASAYDRVACSRIARLKRRSVRKSFIVVGANLAQIQRFVTLETPMMREILESWPGPHTWILPARRTAPRWLKNGQGQIAVRVTAHRQMAVLCGRAGPVVSTSANLAGRKPARTVLAARRYFDKRIECYLGGQVGSNAGPTAIRDGSTGKIIRAQ
ncbi:MAG: L-threonylcarbamoyladenylate synthase [Proteobacteria bacterium]|nr:L-threonylcarbamoyladenylate synthase [Pseudomonadota bacterium]